MKNTLFWVTSTVILLIGSLSLHAAETSSPVFIDKTVNNYTNLHFSGKYCTECHERVPKPGEPLNLRFNNNYIQSCRCHGYLPDTYIHPVYIVPSKDKKIKIPDTMPLQDGKITCGTCHEVSLQCRVNPVAQWQNSAFLRGAPYSSRTGICKRCHNQGNYKMLDPHNQIDYDGLIISEKCLYCHVEVPDVDRTSYLPTDSFTKTTQLVGDLTNLCSRCHNDQCRNHPISTNHFVKPSPKIRATMLESEKRLGIILPLDPAGKVSCPTCHNPHEKGVIPPGRVASRGAGEKYRLRVPGKSAFDQICQACHRK